MTVQETTGGARTLPTAGERGYHAFATCDQPAGWLTTVEDQVGSWLRAKKRLDVDVTVNGSHAEPKDGRTLTVRHHQTGHERAVRFVMEEVNATGRWTTEVTAVEHLRGGGWVSVSVTSSDGVMVLVPGVARGLLQTLRLIDGQELTAVPRMVRADQVDDLISLLVDPTRRGAVFVAATDDRLPFDPFVQRVTQWTEQVTGVGHVAILDPAATVEMHARLGRQWTAPPWTLRTYLPGLDLSQSATSRQHRILGTERLGQDSDKYLRTLLGSFARQAISQHATPRQLVAWHRTFDRLDNSAIAAAIIEPIVVQPPAAVSAGRAPAPTVEAPAPITEQDVQDSAVGAEAGQFLADLERVRATLGLVDLTEDTLLALAQSAAAPRADPHALADAVRRIERLQRDREDLQSALDDAKRALLDEQLDHIEDREELERQQDKAAWFGRQFTELGRHDLTYNPVPDDEVVVYPGSYAELLEVAKALEARGVFITANVDTVLGLERIDPTSKALTVAWDCLLALADYVSAKGAGLANANVHRYLENTPPGHRGMPPGKHSWTETGITMQQFGEERSLPVPVTVDPSGSAQMRSHFKLARIGTQSPRLYYLDDVASTGNVYVGYIGPHMTNTQT
ncbi:hypothetical protein [uncultured Cellulomonas sp.]|uniref:hypothetical protein n=1 Tax=uncultured Cellulomonas sp. TaxID=189682 RepID=UPI0028EF0197|nr:hypothetical protein [uncultured Cellulomonas sp.]